MRSFVEAASKGLFGYDIDFKKNTYFLVAKPIGLLTLLELPLEIRKIIYNLPQIIQSGAIHIAQIE